MAFEYIGLWLNENSMQNRSAERRILQQVEDTFDLTEIEFKTLYRLDKTQVYEVVDGIEDCLTHNRIAGITPDKQVLSIRFYAFGCFQRPVGEQWGISFSQSSISRCLHRVTDAINNNLFGQFVKFPITTYERNCCKEVFRSSPYPFEGCIGAIDCSHISIIAPKNHEGAYVNHHGYHSLNVQMIYDPTLKILNVNAKFPGARHDAYIWGCSPVRDVMERAFSSGERRTFLIGDMGYPLQPWLMTPLPHEIPGTPRFLYNEALCKTRNSIERAYGVLKGTWRCLSRHRSGKIVNACATLHNLKIRDNYDVLEHNIIEESSSYGNENNELSTLAVARRIQEQIITQYFT